MRKQFARLSRLLTIALFAFTVNPASTYEWPGVYDPMQLISLNLDMDPADWDTIKVDTTHVIEVPVMYWSDYEHNALQPYLMGKCPFKVRRVSDDRYLRKKAGMPGFLASNNRGMPVNVQAGHAKTGINS